MRVDYAFICDYADTKDKVNALGIGFEKIFAAQVPTTHPHFHIVAQLRFSRSEVGAKDVVVLLIDADGGDVISPLKGRIDIKQPPPGQLETTVRINMGFNNVKFKDYGNYSVRVSVAGQEMVDIPLRIEETPKAA
ncbi:DUF6941 family protein [Chloroflexota bacterium]